RGMLRYSADTGTVAPRRLLYSARVPEELVFRKELDALARGSSNLEVQYSVTRPADSSAPWDGRVGRIGLDWLRDSVASLERPKFYIAGLPEMVEEMNTLLREKLGVDESDIEYEVFRGF
ncbi:MAG: hypothetical protein L3K15_07660, partial [Thermoplasmata archaeon]|nr:hypothetical protein [Thermoplasmata archaeon]